MGLLRATSKLRRRLAAALTGSQPARDALQPGEAQSSAGQQDTTQRVQSFLDSYRPAWAAGADCCVGIALFGLPLIDKSLFLWRLVGNRFPLEYDPTDGYSSGVDTVLELVERRVRVVVHGCNVLPNSIAITQDFAMQMMDFYILAYNTRNRQSFEVLEAVNERIIYRRHLISPDRPWKAGCIVAITSNGPGDTVDALAGSQLAEQLGTIFVPLSVQAD